MKLTLRRLQLADVEEYQYWKLPQHEYHSLNGPYFKKDSREEIEKQMESLKNDLQEGKEVLPNRRIISNSDKEMIGEVSWHWKSEETNWMEIGIVIFDKKFWNKGIGYQALQLWMKEIFQEKSDIIRLGISTWSGNAGMIQLAKKLGMQLEATYRKARIVNGEYFDSISYGILREEWERDKE